MNVGILEPDHFEAATEAMLRNLGPVDRFAGSSLRDFLLDKEVLLIRLSHRINADFLAMAPKLKVLASATTGLTHIDIAELQHRGIKLLSLKGLTPEMENIRATPELALGLILGITRQLPQAVASVSNGLWSRELFLGDELYEMPIGIVGFGRVGTTLATYLRCIGSRISWYDPNLSSSYSTAERRDSLSALIAGSELIVLCANYEPGAPPVLGKEQLDLMKNKFLVNVARGELIDENHLFHLTAHNHFKGVALDVIDNDIWSDRRGAWSELLRSGSCRVLITPHIGGFTAQSLAKAELKLVEFIMSELGAT